MTRPTDDLTAVKAMLRDAFSRAYNVGHSHGRISPKECARPEDHDAYFDFEAEIATVAEWFAKREAPPAPSFLTTECHLTNIDLEAGTATAFSTIGKVTSLSFLTGLLPTDEDGDDDPEGGDQ